MTAKIPIQNKFISVVGFFLKAKNVESNKNGTGTIRSNIFFARKKRVQPGKATANRSG